MKTLLNILIIAALATTSAFADAKVKAGPRKGLLLDLGGKQAEFFVEKDRSISIAVYDAALKAQPASTEVITATAEAPSGKVKIEFEKKGDLLVSKTKLPEGEGYQVVLQAKPPLKPRKKNFRIKLLLHTCKECSNPEYACTCDECHG
jgi:response regulator RpfG family c-di-GMP phosphodiesterase